MQILLDSAWTLNIWRSLEEVFFWVSPELFDKTLAGTLEDIDKVEANPLLCFFSACFGSLSNWKDGLLSQSEIPSPLKQCCIGVSQ